MDAGIADTINRETVRTAAAQLDILDQTFGNTTPWHAAPMADTFMGENDATEGDRAWLATAVIKWAADATFDGPADEDWDNLFSHIRTEITARRDKVSNN